jgi:hypothetical protein
MADIDKLLQELKQKRDEIRLHIHLASKDAKDEWAELEKKMDDFSGRAKLHETGDGVGDALGRLGNELKLGFERVRKAIRD